MLVTGGGGFLGAWVGLSLAQLSVRPILFDIAQNSPLLRQFEHEYWPGDIRRREDLDRCVAEHGVKRIIHTAAITEPLMRACNESVADQVDLNIAGTISVLETARQCRLGVVFISTKAVYGSLAVPPVASGLPRLVEDHPKAPTTLYGSTKLVGEQLMAAYRATWAVDYAIVRFATLWGPGKAGRYALLAPHSLMIEAAAAGRHYELQKGGDQPDDMIYIRDAARGVATLALTSCLNGQDYNLGSGRPQRMSQLADFLRRKFPSWSAHIGAGMDYLGVGDVGAYSIVDSTKAREAFAFQAEYDLTSGTEDYLTTMGHLRR
ncbi:MAG: NAD-dependent epimerase/dehydratase family protein [Betaproteobacteria bacterium]